MLGAKRYVDQLRNKARQLHEEAKLKEQALDSAGAAKGYLEVAVLLRQVGEKVTASDDRIRYFKKAKQIEERASLLKQGRKCSPGRDEIRDSVPADDEYKASVDELIYQSSVTWDDIGGMDEIKASLKYTMGLILALPPENVRLEIPSRFLLYGPPGVGKTLLAAVCSNMLGATFFCVKASDLMSKYFGESPKLISALYSRARNEAVAGASVIFIDEFESLCCKSGRDETGAERRILATLLAELDGLKDKGEATRVITIVATNNPWDISEAILHRFERHFLVDLPDQEGREAIFRIHVGGNGLRLADDVNYALLSSATEGCSGRSIQHICKDAVEVMIHDMNANIARNVDDRTIGDYAIQCRPLVRNDFAGPLHKARPKTSRENLQRYRTWAKESGG